MVEFKDKMKNVAFGGNWSEELVSLDECTAALRVLERAVDQCTEEDPRGPDLEMALGYVAARAEKGRALTDRLRRSFAIANQGERQREARAVLRLIRNWLC